jgi:hypothetical protein
MHLSESQISLYAEALRNHSEGKLPANILEHVEECLLCKHEVLEIVSILSDIEKAEKLKPKAVMRSYFNYWKAAAVIFILLVPVYFLYTYHTPAIVETASTTNKVYAEPNKAPLTGDKKSAAIQNLKQNDLASNDIYAPIPEYDEMCGENFRSDKFFNVTSPSLSVESKGIIKFDISFRNKTEGTVTVFNNKNEQVFYNNFNQDVVGIEHSFPPGLYYWKLETPSDLIYISKFIILK